MFSQMRLLTGKYYFLEFLGTVKTGKVGGYVLISVKFLLLNGAFDLVRLVLNNLA